MRCDPDRFLTELHKLFERNTEAGSVYVTIKRTAERPKRSKAPAPTESDFRCLVRASDGKKKVSATLDARQLASFREAYSTILRGNLSALKRRERTRAAKKA